MKAFTEFLIDSGKWGVTSELAALVALGVSFYEHFHDKAVSSFVFLCASLVLVMLGAGAAWNKKRSELESEKDKNRIAPKVEIQITKTISNGALKRGVTDLFVYVILTLREPSEVFIRDFSIECVDGTDSLKCVAVNDMNQWRIKKELKYQSGFSYIACIPVEMALTRRGDPMQGWIHFPTANWPESLLHRSKLWIKLNSAYGTCVEVVDGFHCAFTNINTTGVMRRHTDPS